MGMGEAGRMEEYPKVSKNPTALCVLSHFSHVQLFESPPGSSVHGIL